MQLVIAEKPSVAQLIAKVLALVAKGEYSMEEFMDGDGIADMVTDLV